MSQFISGDLGQTVTNELGPFITINDHIRIRRDHMCAYYYHSKIDDKDIERHYLFINAFSSMSSALFTELPTKEAVEKEIARLDWLFAGLYKRE